MGLSNLPLGFLFSYLILLKNIHIFSFLFLQHSLSVFTAIWTFSFCHQVPYQIVLLTQVLVKLSLLNATSHLIRHHGLLFFFETLLLTFTCHPIVQVSPYYYVNPKLFAIFFLHFLIITSSTSILCVVVMLSYLATLCTMTYPLSKSGNLFD